MPRIVKVSDSFDEEPGSAPSGDLVSDLAKAVSGAALAFWLITVSLSFALAIDAIYFLAAFGLLYSIQASYYSYRLRVDPGYRIPSCGCGTVPESAERVLGSPHGSLLGIPNGLFGVLWYGLLIALVRTGVEGVVIPLAALSVLASAYLAWVMVAWVRGLCSICIYTFAINALILWQLSMAGG